MRFHRKVHNRFIEELLNGYISQNKLNKMGLDIGDGNERTI